MLRGEQGALLAHRYRHQSQALFAQPLRLRGDVPDRVQRLARPFGQFVAVGLDGPGQGGAGQRIGQRIAAGVQQYAHAPGLQPGSGGRSGPAGSLAAGRPPAPRARRVRPGSAKVASASVSSSPVAVRPGRLMSVVASLSTSLILRVAPSARTKRSSMRLARNRASKTPAFRGPAGPWRRRPAPVRQAGSDVDAPCPGIVPDRLGAMYVSAFRLSSVTVASTAGFRVTVISFMSCLRPARAACALVSVCACVARACSSGSAGAGAGAP